MGLKPEVVEKVPEKAVPNATGEDHSQKPEESKLEAYVDNVGGCCQGTDGFSCCRVENVILNGTEVDCNKKSEENKAEANLDNSGRCYQGADGFSCCRDGRMEVRAEKKLREVMEVHRKKGLGKISSWFGPLEQNNVLPAIAVIGAVAAVTMA